MGVITLSLAAASIGLPLLLKGLAVPADPLREAEEASARVGAAHAAIAEIERLERRRSESSPEADIAVAAAARVMDIYRARIESRSGDREAIALAQRGEAIEREMRLAGLLSIAALACTARPSKSTTYRTFAREDLNPCVI